MIKVYIDGIEVFVEKGSTVLQACEAVGLEIPRFCYHERLSVAGNCRMCLVEIEKTPKPVSSCTMPTMPGMKVFTDTPLVKKAREAVLEFLLLNHPLDCPICDQGGECDLQDQAMAFGSDRSRYFDTKRSVEDKECGPLIKTVMTRCIHCTRCVRFSTEIAGVEDLGTTGRGREVEIGTYVSKTIDSELSGNVIDLCPVGALTSKPYAFVTRPWEVRSTDTIDVSDGIGSNIRIDSRGTDILRVLPRFSEEINEEWITDKARFSFDGLQVQRLTTPLMRQGDTFQPVSWEEAFEKIGTHLRKTDGSRLHGLVGESVDSETAYILRKFLLAQGSSSLRIQGCASDLDNSFPSSYTMNPSIYGIEDADLCLLIGVDTRFESSLLNVRLRKRSLEGCFTVGTIGPAFDPTYPVEHLGSTMKTLMDLVEGKHSFCKDLYEAKNPIILCGSSLFEGCSKESVETVLERLILEIPAISRIQTQTEVQANSGFVHTGPNTVGLLDLGIKPNSEKNLTSFLEENSMHFLVGTDSDYHSRIESILHEKKESSFIVYVGHLPAGATTVADLILPGAAFTEKQFRMTNIEGRTQEGRRVLKTPGLAREDWKVLRALTEFMGINSLNHVNAVDNVRKGLQKLIPSQISIGNLPGRLTSTSKNVHKSVMEIPTNRPLTRRIDDFYLTNEITKTSRVMADCSSTFTKHTNFIK